jgi:cation diffusion facilitator family transporter
MTGLTDGAPRARHDHIFLGAAHEQNEKKTWAVIALCGAMMCLEIIGGSLFGSLALVADGLHMSTHAGAMLIAALAYTYARKHASDRRFVFGTGKLGDLAGFTSAIVLAMIALLIAYEAILRFLAPVPIHFREAIPIAVLGLVVNLVSVWLLSGDHHGHSHSHDHGPRHAAHVHAHDDEVKRVFTKVGVFDVSVFEDGVPPMFCLTPATPDSRVAPQAVSIATVREDGARQTFTFVERGGCLQSTEAIPEPHRFQAILQLNGAEHTLEFVEHQHDHRNTHSATHRDHSIRSAYLHVMADAAISVLAIAGLLLARGFGWLWLDPLAGVIGALVIANWSYSLMRDTAKTLLDISVDPGMVEDIQHAVEATGDQIDDLHVWRLGPGHLGAVVSVFTEETSRTPSYYRSLLKRFKALSHVTVEVNPGSACR